MRTKFKYRSYQPEMMDFPDVPADLLIQNLRELDLLNRFTGGHGINLTGLKMLLNNGKKSCHIVDLGCGSGDALRYLAKWARKNHIAAQFTGVDKHPDAIAYLGHHCREYPEINGVKADYLDFVYAENEVDVYLCSLFCHHLSDDEIKNLLELFKQKAGLGFVINDLIRSPLAYYGAGLFSKIAMATPLARHDGPVSVLKGFKVMEMKEFIENAGVLSYKIMRTGGFRLLAVGKTGKLLNNV